MFRWPRRATIIGDELKVVGKITAEGLVKVYGQIEGELQCGSLVVHRKARLRGPVAASKVVIDGQIDGPIHGANVLLKSCAHVVGDIHHQTLDIRKGAYFEGRAVHVQGPNGPHPVGKKRRAAGGNPDLGSTADPPV
jgi:cytoskeletal protein CcmA (bactofilin family)